MVMVGAAVDDLERLATIMERSGHRLVDVRAALDAQIRGTRWTGPDGARFGHEWSSNHGPRLAAVGNALLGLSQVLRKQAHEQAAASAAGAGELGNAQRVGGGGSWGGARSAVDAIAEFGNRIKPPFMIKDVSDIVQRLIQDKGALAPMAERIAHSVGQVGDNVADLIQKGFPGLTDDVLRKTLRGADTVLGAAGTAFGVVSIVDDGAKLVENVQREGWSAESWFKTFDVAGDVLQTSKSPVGFLGGFAIKEWTDVAREAQKIDFSDLALPPITRDNIKNIYLPGIGDSFVSTMKTTWGNL